MGCIPNGRSFRNVRLALKAILKIENGHYEVVPTIKKMVTFQYLNLAEDVYPSLLNNTKLWT